jgi:hypothetical protein
MQIKNNIIFKIGQPSTGKSYGFRLDYLKDNFEGFENLASNEYLLIPVSGGVGNEYKGLQNTDLALSWDPIKQTVKFGEFLQMLMKAIVNPSKKHVVFLDDFHNQDISSLLSEFTPLFKAQQKVNLTGRTTPGQELLTTERYENHQLFISDWNTFIESLRNDNTTIIPITNRISGESIKLVYPSNFYLFGAANFNEKTVSIFADWADRAYIEYIDCLDEMKIFQEIKDPDDTNVFAKCVRDMNNHLKNILEDDEIGIYDYEKYCFGIWKIVDETGQLPTEADKQKELIKFLFGMIKNSLVYNNKNSYINDIGKKLLTQMKTNGHFSTLFGNDLREEITNKTLHKFAIYES